MRITGAHVAIAIWLVSLVASIAIAAVLIFKQRSKGTFSALLTICGALLMVTFVSAVIGLYDLNGYFFTLQFAASVAIGVVGLVLFGLGVWRVLNCLKKEPTVQTTSLQTGRETAPPREARAEGPLSQSDARRARSPEGDSP